MAYGAIEGRAYDNRKAKYQFLVWIYLFQMKSVRIHPKKGMKKDESYLKYDRIFIIVIVWDIYNYANKKYHKDKSGLMVIRHSMISLI